MAGAGRRLDKLGTEFLEDPYRPGEDGAHVAVDQKQAEVG
jgi:hypothetical protein